MPTRQDTFKLVPTTLVNTTGPRPPMTSKAAKRAYREASRLPRISRAEQRRIEAAEIARQKKEYEKEKAGAKAKAAREKKLKKEAEERAKRKELGLPEPSRFVRPSQPTIKTFVKLGIGQKRAYGEVDNTEEQIDTRDEDYSNLQHTKQAKTSVNRTELEREDGDDEFGDFPSLSQADLPTLFAECDKVSSVVSLQSPPMKSPCTMLQSSPAQCKAAEHISKVDQLKVDARMAESQLLADDLLSRTTMLSEQQFKRQKDILQASSSLCQSMIETPTMTTNLPKLHNLKTSQPSFLSCGSVVSAEEISKAITPPAIPTMSSRLRPRFPLSQVSRNVMPLRPSQAKCFTSTNKIETKLNQKSEENFSLPPPSTLAFLEAHLDDFFPSPSQQVRELLEDVDDMPSNTQIAKEISLEQASIVVTDSRTITPLPRSQVRIEEEALHFLSSQDLEISSEDLRDIDTPSKAISKGSHLQELSTQVLTPSRVIPAPPPTPKLKPRFFEEKEDDILHAALHESFLLSKQTTQCFSPRRSQRVLRRSRSARTNSGQDGYESDGSDLDAALIALMDRT